MLEGSLVWEARSLCFIAVGAPAIVIYRLAGLVILGLAVLVVVVMVLPLVFYTLHSQLFGSHAPLTYREIPIYPFHPVNCTNLFV
jgi:hypothetical protein